MTFILLFSEDHDLITMFSSKSYLEKKTGPYGIGRLSYLQSLVVEYQDTTDLGKYRPIAQLVERPLSEWEVVDSNPGHTIPKV